MGVVSHSYGVLDGGRDGGGALHGVPRMQLLMLHGGGTTIPTMI